LGELAEAGNAPGAEQIAVRLLRQFVKVRFWEGALALAWPEIDLSEPAEFHRDFWAWFCAIEEGAAPPAFIGCWFRGAGKTQSIQLALAMAAMLHLRPYWLYVGDTQGAVADKVAGVGDLIRAPRVAAAFPLVAAPYLSTSTGLPVDQRVGRIRTASGWALDALGMDQAIRGRKLGDHRPGGIVIDDPETSTDTEFMLRKKRDVMVRVIIPAGSADCVYAFIENLINESTAMHLLVSGKADFLGNRHVSGPVPQIEDLEIERVRVGNSLQYEITGGSPTWPAGADLEVSQRQLNDSGEIAFRAEKQHEVTFGEGTMFPRNLFAYTDVAPPGLLVCRSWDLAGSTGASSDYSVGSLLGWSMAEGRLYVLDVARGRWETDEVEHMVATLAEQDRAEFGRYTVVIEDQPGAAGKMWSKRWQRDVLAGFPIELVPPMGSKVWRADALSSTQRKGLVTLVQGDWCAPFVAECSLFGTDFCRHDDQVDSASLGFNYLTGRSRKSKGSLASAARRQIG
jgi:predicted phage terminase large subunit-like protein